MKLIAGSSDPDFAERISKHLKHPLTPCTIGRFGNGECAVRVGESVRGEDCFVLQGFGAESPSGGSVNDQLVELLVVCDALRRGSSRSISVVVPCLGYARQDRKDSSRVPVSASMVAHVLQAVQITRVIVCDLHASQIQGFFSVPVDNLYVGPYLTNYIETRLMKKIGRDNVVIVSPDEGGVKRAVAAGNRLQCAVATVHKERSNPGEVSKMTLMGSVEGKVAILIDDMLDSGGTACKAGQVLKDHGATSVYFLCTHGLLSGPAIERIESSVFERVVITNTTPVSQRVFLSGRIEVIDVSWLVAEAIRRTMTGESLSELYESGRTGAEVVSTIENANVDSSATTLGHLAEKVLTYHENFPKPGVTFVDIQSLLLRPDAWAILMGRLERRYRGEGITAIVGPEARGFLFVELASRLRVPFILCRKKGKLPGKTIDYTYEKEYGSDTLCLQEAALASLSRTESKLLVCDDLLATGGTLNAVRTLLVDVAGFENVETFCLIGIDFADGAPLKLHEDVRKSTYTLFDLGVVDGKGGDQAPAAKQVQKE